MPRDCRGTEPRATADAALDLPWPSLDVVRAELDIEIQAQAKRAESADVRAGVLLGAAGALAGLAVNARTPFALPGAVTALAAAVLAAQVLRPGLRHVVDPVMLRRLYVAAADTTTKQAVLDRRVVDFASNDAVVATKTTRLKRAIVTLVAATALVVGGVAVKTLLDVLGGPAADMPTHRRDEPMTPRRSGDSAATPKKPATVVRSSAPAGPDGLRLDDITPDPRIAKTVETSVTPSKIRADVLPRRADAITGGVSGSTVGPTRRGGTGWQEDERAPWAR